MGRHLYYFATLITLVAVAVWAQPPWWVIVPTGFWLGITVQAVQERFWKQRRWDIHV